jgi:hypothetical protein
MAWNFFSSRMPCPDLQLLQKFHAGQLGVELYLTGADTARASLTSAMSDSSFQR